MTTVGRAEIIVVADAAEFDRQMRRLVSAARRGFGGMRSEADTNFNGAAESSKRFGNTLSTVTSTFNRFRRRLGDVFGSSEQFRESMRNALPALRNFGSSIGGTLVGAGLRLVNTFTSVVAVMGKVTAAGLAVGAIAGALGAAAASAIQFTAALAPAVGIVAGVPAAIGVAGAAIATLQVALSGVADAFSAAVSGDTEKFNAALEGLSPNARAAATALRDITPAFSDLRAQVQDAFFAGFDDTLRSIASTLVGPLTEGMTAAAEGLAGITTRLGEAATSGAGVAFIENSFTALSNILANLQEPLGLLFEAFLSLGSAIAIAFGSAETAGAGLGDLITRFAEFINTAADSGAAISWVEGAIGVFSALGAIISPVIGILGSVGAAAQATGGNILGALGAALEAVNAFLSSAEGMRVLESIFTTLNAVGSAFGDVIAGLLPVIAPVIASLVSGLVPVLEAITPLLLEIAAAAGPLFTQILDAVLPLIPPLVQIAQLLLPLLATVLSGLVAAAAPLLEVLVNLLVSVLEPLLPALMPLVELFAELAMQLATALTPILTLLGEILAWVVNEIIVPFVIPIIEFLVGLLGDTLVGAVEDLGTVFEVVVNAIVAVATWLKEQWDKNALAMRLAWDLLKAGLQAGKNFIVNNVINPIANFFTGLKNTLASVVSNMRSKFDGFVSAIKGAPGKIKSALSNMFSPMWNGFKSAINSIIRGWNNLSFSVPSVDLGPLGSVGGFTISTPNIPTLQTSGFSFGEGAVVLHPNEAIVNAKDPRGIAMLADALTVASGMTAGPGLAGDIEVRVYIGDRELTDIIDVRVEQRDRTLAHRARTGSGRR